MAVALLLGLGLHAAARADANVAALTRQLESPSDKTRLAAVLALAKLGDPAACKPLMTSLRDASPRVRAVAATALGRLEYAPALPALRALATGNTSTGNTTCFTKLALPMKIDGARPSALAMISQGTRPVST